MTQTLTTKIHKKLPFDSFLYLLMINCLHNKDLRSVYIIIILTHEQQQIKCAKLIYFSYMPLNSKINKFPSVSANKKAEQLKGFNIISKYNNVYSEFYYN